MSKISREIRERGRAGKGCEYVGALGGQWGRLSSHVQGEQWEHVWVERWKKNGTGEQKEALILGSEASLQLRLGNLIITNIICWVQCLHRDSISLDRDIIEINVNRGVNGTQAISVYRTSQLTLTPFSNLFLRISQTRLFSPAGVLIPSDCVEWGFLILSPCNPVQSTSADILIAEKKREKTKTSSLETIYSMWLQR